MAGRARREAARDGHEEESFSYGLTLFLAGLYADRVEAFSKGALPGSACVFAT
jgi:hypothetical protein